MPYPDVPRPDVPAPIAVVRDFVNTTDLETGGDDLSTPAELVRWLAGAGLVTGAPGATGHDLALARQLRAGLRAALEHNHDHASAELPELEASLASLDIALTWSASGAMLKPASGGVRGALAAIGIAAHQAAADGLWHRLKICSSDECAWAYFDHSKNRSRQWCEYGCGNRIKTRAYRARQRSAAPA
ncbi:MAG: CGNR zinc finger domain-containing protein [Nocardioidaceae bacterium]|nr:CGNR zinc finger domain-containing protein [Nocardioidaceae bacterium]